MSRLLALLILGLVAFYVAWPAWSGYQIKTALDAGDAAGLARKIDFDRVRSSLRPAVTAEVEKSLGAAIAASGQPPEVVAKVKADATPKLVDTALNGIVTPESVVRLYRERANLRTVVARIVAEKLASREGLAALGSLAGAMSPGKVDTGNIIGQLGKLAEQSGVDPGKILDGLFGKKDGGAGSVGTTTSGSGAGGTGSGAADSGGITIDNIKSFAMVGFTGYAIGIAKDKAATRPDITAELAFTGSDWQLVALTPNT
ncbi:MAG: DUF2939 domain-containing protein [Hyphomicrobium aestuarii]|nr:DUF2939 domain-containing protein [Hyphomicrobium aestuarii]